MLSHSGVQPFITVLGPQYRRPNLAEAVRARGLRGPLLAITAGWQEREGELEDLSTHLGQQVEDLGLYHLAEQLFAADPALAQAHRERQRLLQELRELYLLRLGHAKATLRALFEHDGDPRHVVPARRQALGALRRLDKDHFRAVARVHAEHERSWGVEARPALQHAVQQLRLKIARAAGVLIAGGHVAVLMNRLRLFGAQRWLAGQPIVAWSAGSMVLGSAVVLFHDQPPQGAGNVEVFDTGLGLLPALQLFPDGSRRLKLDQPTRVALLARRFAPKRCLVLDEGACLHLGSGPAPAPVGVRRLLRSGSVRPL